MNDLERMWKVVSVLRIFLERLTKKNMKNLGKDSRGGPEYEAGHSVCGEKCVHSNYQHSERHVHRRPSWGDETDVKSRLVPWPLLLVSGFIWRLYQTYRLYVTEWKMKLRMNQEGCGRKILQAYARWSRRNPRTQTQNKRLSVSVRNLNLGQNSTHRTTCC
jgi:hypothetical protein